MFRSKYISSKLEQLHPLVLTLWSVLAAYNTYFSMYAFRKPYTVAKYEGLMLAGLDYKVVLLFSQVGGYAISTFIGIKVISEMAPDRRARTILALVGFAHVALLGHAVAPLWLKPVCLFFNGLPLGMVFGCVFAFLEGRRQTEAMAAGLCASFIMASGSVKSVGAMLMEYQGVSQFWMPFATGSIFWVPLLIGVWMLQQIPPPSDQDVSARAPRPPIDRDERRQFFSRHRLGISVLVLIMMMLTVFRTIRDDYAAEIWSGFGVSKPEIFAQSETLVAVFCVFLAATAVFVRSNYRAFVISMLLTGIGFAAALTTAASYWGTQLWTPDSAFRFMVILGISLYVPYVLFHTTIFERLIATLREKSNYGYLMYLADFSGYLTSVGLLITGSVISTDKVDFVSLLFWIAIVISPLSILGVGIVIVYFRGKQVAVIESASPQPAQ